jgi:hypothetical protein
VRVLEPTMVLNVTFSEGQPEPQSVDTSVFTHCPPQVTPHHEYMDVSMTVGLLIKILPTYVNECKCVSMMSFSSVCKKQLACSHSFNP